MDCQYQNKKLFDIKTGTVHLCWPSNGPVSCDPIPLDPYDVSWNEERVIHDKVVRLQSTGNIIEQTLSTFLMKDGRLCDGSKFDEDGAYCRYVSQQMSFSFLDVTTTK